MEQLLEYIKNIAFFLILMSVVSNVLPDNGYKKYCRLFCGLILVVMVITPFYEFLNYEGDIKDIFISKSYMLQMEDLENQLIMQEDSYEERIKAEYERLLLDELKGFATEAGLYLSDVSVEITGEEEFSLSGIKLYVGKEKSDSYSGKINIDKIQIGSKEYSENIRQNKSPSVLQLINSVAGLLDVDESIISVIET